MRRRDKIALQKILNVIFRKENSQVEWRDIAGFRDIAAHKYETINMEQLYGTAKKDFPKLKSQIEKILEIEKKNFRSLSAIFFAIM